MTDIFAHLQAEGKEKGWDDVVALALKPVVKEWACV